MEDLGKFLDSELDYHNKCREELMNLRQEWPAAYAPCRPLYAQADPRSGARQQKRNSPRSRSNTTQAHNYNERSMSYSEEPAIEVEPPRQAIRSSAHISSNPAPRPNVSRSSTFQGPTQVSRMNSTSSVAVPGGDMGSLRANLRPTARGSVSTGGSNMFNDPSDDSTFSTSPDRSYIARSISPASSYGSSIKKGPPPPPPNRSTKPPPPPMKRAGLSTGASSYN